MTAVRSRLAACLAVFFLSLHALRAAPPEPKISDEDASPMPKESAPKENPGRDDLDEATDKKLTAKSYQDLTEVIELLDSAINKGLDDNSRKFADKLLVSTLVNRAMLVTSVILDRPEVDPRWRQLRQAALADLERAVKVNPEQSDAFFLIGRLNTLPGGDRERALESFDKIVGAERVDMRTRVRALIYRAALQPDEEKRLADLGEAIKLDPENVEAIRARGLFHLFSDRPKEALDDLSRAAELEDEHAQTFEAIGMAQFQLQKLDDALASFDRAIELNPDSATAYMHRARTYILQTKLDEAIDDLDRSLEINPASLPVLLLRATVHHQAGRVDEALADADRIAALPNGRTPGRRMRAEILAADDRLDEAIDVMKELLADEPTSAELTMQLGLFYQANDQPRAAVDQFTKVIEADETNAQALRSRGDAYLSIARQGAAIEDYNRALKHDPDNDGVLNNLAWVLATSPDDKLRNGERAIELATKASEVTEYKKGHILSTLAAAYAETGNFGKAIEWSTKAVEAGRPQEVDQLKAELESYKQGKPWRELQETEEKQAEKKKEASQPAQTSNF